jgi:hypothetical protein
MNGLRFSPTDVFSRQTGIPSIMLVALRGELVPCLCGERQCAGVKVQIGAAMHFDRQGGASLIEATRVKTETVPVSPAAPEAP